MPTVLPSGPYRFFFYAGDRAEPPHVHIERETNRAKFWPDPVRLQESGGFGRTEINRTRRSWRRTAVPCSEHGMSSSTTEVRAPAAQSVTVTDEALVVDLTDGRTLSVPLAWYPRLLHATHDERSHWRLIGRGEGIHWPDLDEDISVQNLLAGTPSGESQRSLKRWLQTRQNPA